MFVGKSVAIDYSAITGSLLLMIVVPSVIGLSINDYSGGSFSNKYNAFLGPVSSLCLCGVIAVNVATAQSTASSMVNAAPMLIAFSFTLVLSGFLLGWLISYLFGFASKTRIASIYCVGIKNTSCGLVIAIGHLPAEASIPLLIAMFFQQPLAALSQRLFKASFSTD
jgi:predicted Na+-dependent transporter